jgi:hypothetical protein
MNHAIAIALIATSASYTALFVPVCWQRFITYADAIPWGFRLMRFGPRSFSPAERRLTALFEPSPRASAPARAPRHSRSRH